MLDGFEFRPDLTSHFGVSCPWAVKKNDVFSFSQSPLMRYLSNMHVTRAGSTYLLWSYSPSPLYIVTTIVKKTSNKGGVRVNSVCIGRMKPMAKTYMMVAKSFKLYLYLELTVPQVSDCCHLGDLFTFCELYRNIDPLVLKQILLALWIWCAFNLYWNDFIQECR